MAAPKVTLYFDVVSPFAYLAFHVLRVSIHCGTRVDNKKTINNADLM